MSETERKELLNILCQNRTKRTLTIASVETKNQKLKDLLNYYLPDRATDEPLFDELEQEV